MKTDDVLEVVSPGITRRPFPRLRFFLLSGLMAAAVMTGCAGSGGNGKDTTGSPVAVRRGDIRTVISATGTVLPRNRLEIKPPVAGRVEEVLVREGQRVSVGDTLVVMSSSDRAALLDAARAQGPEEFKHWQDVYKPIPLVAPIAGEVIVGTVQPGQTLTVADAAVVLSDRLIVRAQVDETDIGKVREGQSAVLTLSAYPDDQIDAVVDHIYRESTTVNNVTVYEVDLLPAAVTERFRSGMNATVDFILEQHAGVLLVPAAAVQGGKDSSAVVLLWKGPGVKPEARSVVTGLADEKNMEIVSGLNEGDKVMSQAKQRVRDKRSGGSNPFAPARPSGSRRS